jgi:hypothetical protein
MIKSRLRHLTTIPTYLICHAVMPFPMDLVVKQIGYDTVSVALTTGE